MRYLVYQFSYKPSKEISFALDYMSLQASKLWNVANYERLEFETLGFESEPSWFDQKKRLKTNEHYKMLLAQSSQDLLKDLDLAWKSYHALISAGHKANKPNYKKHGEHTIVKFAYHSFRVINESLIRLSIPASIKKIINDKFHVTNNFIYFRLKRKIIGAKSISVSHQGPGIFKICISYEMDKPKCKKDNGRHIGIDLGVTNLFAVYDNNGSSFIINGSSFKNTIYYFSKKIAHYQKILKASYLNRKPECAYSSQRIRNLYKTKQGRINYLIHAATKKITDYCVKNDISVVVIGDMKGIKGNCSFGHVTKQQFYSIAFDRIIKLLQYKLDNIGVKMVKVNEAYSSQCPPYSLEVSKKYGNKYRRKKRGLYKYKKQIYNSDCLGAFNILRIYYQNIHESYRSLDYRCISNPKNECIPVTMNFFDYFPCLDMKRLVGVAGRDYPSYEQLIDINNRFISCSAEA